MTTTLNTRNRPDGIVCEIAETGMRIGIIRVVPATEVSRFTMWIASPDAQLPRACFMSMQAAEYYMLAAACEYVEVTS